MSICKVFRLDANPDAFIVAVGVESSRFCSPVPFQEITSSPKLGKGSQKALVIWENWERGASGQTGNGVRALALEIEILRRTEALARVWGRSQIGR